MSFNNLGLRPEILAAITKKAIRYQHQYKKKLFRLSYKARMSLAKHKLELEKQQLSDSLYFIFLAKRKQLAETQEHLY